MRSLGCFSQRLISAFCGERGNARGQAGDVNSSLGGNSRTRELSNSSGSIERICRSTLLTRYPHDCTTAGPVFGLPCQAPFGSLSSHPPKLGSAASRTQGTGSSLEHTTQGDDAWPLEP